MNSIRPLVTITILVVVGAYLYVKINEGTVRPAPSANTQWNAPAEGVPPLALADESPTAIASAPQAATTAEPAAPIATTAPDVTAPPIAAVAPATETPAVPPIPEVPQVPSTTAITAQDLSAGPMPTDLPANIPTARYPDEPGAISTGTTTAPIESVAPIAATPVGATPTEPSSVAAGAAIPSTTPDDNPLRQPVDPIAGPDRYATPAPLAETPVAPATTPVQAPTAEASFAVAWPEIQATLDRGDLASAHQQLSRWYDDPSLTPTDAERVESLLSQLAGTVIYSTEHKLAPAHVVQPGETLETIARQYEVPWQLLAKINGIPAADQIRPGQELKVVRGPFQAVVDLTRSRMTLVVDSRYAGRFSVTMPRDAEPPIGEWYVQEKPAAMTTRQLLLANADSAAAGDKHISIVGAAEITPTSATTGAAATGTQLTVSPSDVEELADILSVGSRVSIRK